MRLVACLLVASVVGSTAGAQPFGFAKLTPIQKRHGSGALAEALGPQRVGAPPGSHILVGQ